MTIIYATERERLKEALKTHPNPDTLPPECTIEHHGDDNHRYWGNFSVERGFDDPTFVFSFEVEEMQTSRETDQLVRVPPYAELVHVVRQKIEDQS